MLLQLGIRFAGGWISRAREHKGATYCFRFHGRHDELATDTEHSVQRVPTLNHAQMQPIYLPEARITNV